MDINPLLKSPLRSEQVVSNVDVEDFIVEKECVFDGERYSPDPKIDARQLFREKI